jgi:IS4 transposase
MLRICKTLVSGYEIKKVIQISFSVYSEILENHHLKLSAKTIADIYKARWGIELFFKCIKQNLKIKKFFGTTPNAVFTQIWIAMIAYLMTSFHKFVLKSKRSIQYPFRFLRSQLFERCSIK